MRIAYVSDCPPLTFTTAAYVRSLDAAMRDRTIDSAVITSLETSSGNLHASAAEVYTMVLHHRPDVVHIQHDYTSGPSRGPETIDLVLRLRMLGLPIVVTLHMPEGDSYDEDRIILRHLLPECAAIIVPEQSALTRLALEFGPGTASTISVIDNDLHNHGDWSLLAQRHETVYRSVLERIDDQAATRLPALRVADPDRPNDNVPSEPRAPKPDFAAPDPVIRARRLAVRMKRANPTLRMPLDRPAFEDDPRSDNDLVSWLSLHA